MIAMVMCYLHLVVSIQKISCPVYTSTQVKPTHKMCYSIIFVCYLSVTHMVYALLTCFTLRQILPLCKNSLLNIYPFGIHFPHNWNLFLKLFTHISLASFLWDIGKQHSPRCDAAECGAHLGLFCLHREISSKNEIKKNKNHS